MACFSSLSAAGQSQSHHSHTEHRGSLAYAGLFAWIAGSPFVLQALRGLTPGQENHHAGKQVEQADQDRLHAPGALLLLGPLLAVAGGVGGLCAGAEEKLALLYAETNPRRLRERIHRERDELFDLTARKSAVVAGV